MHLLLTVPPIAKMFYHIGVALIFFLYIIYRWLSRPLNRIRRLGDVGLYFNDSRLKGTRSDVQIERARRLRAIGDIPPVYPNGWFCIAESDQIQPKEVRGIVVFASFNVGGRVVDDNCVQCPFHGWIFSGESGKCTRIPYNTQTIPEQAKVSVWPVVERNRHVYVWCVPEIEEVASGEWAYKGRTEHEIQCHVQDLPENGSDLAHLNYLHLAGVNKGNYNAPSNSQHIWDGRWEPQPEPNRHIAIMYLDQVMTVMKMRIPLTSSSLRAKQIGPGIVHMMFDFAWLGRGVVMHHFRVLSIFLWRLATCLRHITLPRYFFLKLLSIAALLQFERDIFIWNNKRYVRPPILVKNDGPIGKHRRWYSQFYSENSPKLNKDGTLTNQPKSVLDW
uniref:cholesterol 7-desaturase n=1 Tax=Parascaris equorum TaxID=6256 RepID=A0A914RXK5_PAREQ